MAIDVGALVKDMLAAARGTLSKKQWTEVRDYAESEFKKIGEAITFIEAQRAARKMSAPVARLHLSIQTNAARAVLLTVEGIGLLSAEEAINAALAVVQKTVNTALGFKLIA